MNPWGHVHCSLHCLEGLDWDPLKGLAISGRKGPLDPHGKVTTHFRRGSGGMTPLGSCSLFIALLRTQARAAKISFFHPVFC